MRCSLFHKLQLLVCSCGSDLKLVVWLLDAFSKLLGKGSITANWLVVAGRAKTVMCRFSSLFPRKVLLHLSARAEIQVVGDTVNVFSIWCLVFLPLYRKSKFAYLLTTVHIYFLGQPFTGWSSGQRWTRCTSWIRVWKRWRWSRLSTSQWTNTFPISSLMFSQGIFYMFTCVRHLSLLGILIRNSYANWLLSCLATEYAISNMEEYGKELRR